MVGMASSLIGGYYRQGKHGLILLCGRCAQQRGLWPADRLAPPDRHYDCTDCGGPVE